MRVACGQSRPELRRDGGLAGGDIGEERNLAAGVRGGGEVRENGNLAVCARAGIDARHRHETEKQHNRQPVDGPRPRLRTHVRHPASGALNGEVRCRPLRIFSGSAIRPVLLRAG